MVHYGKQCKPSSDAHISVYDRFLHDVSTEVRSFFVSLFLGLSGTLNFKEHFGTVKDFLQYVHNVIKVTWMPEQKRPSVYTSMDVENRYTREKSLEKVLERMTNQTTGVMGGALL